MSEINGLGHSTIEEAKAAIDEKGEVEPQEELQQDQLEEEHGEQEGENIHNTNVNEENNEESHEEGHGYQNQEANLINEGEGEASNE